MAEGAGGVLVPISETLLMADLATICAMGQVRRLGRLPILDPLTPEGLRSAFAANFKLEDFTA